MSKPRPASLDALRSEGDVNISPQRQAWAERNIDPQTQELLKEDERLFLHQSLSTPCLDVIEGCEGPYLITAQGKRLLDFHGNSVHQTGFGHPKVIEAIKSQLDQLSFCTRRYTNRVAVQLAQRLTDLAPGDLNKVLFAPGGSEAISMALKLARYATGRYKTISMWEAFHGATLDAISLGGEAIFRQNVGPLLPGTEHVPPPDASQCPFGCEGVCNLRCAHYIDYVLEREGDVAAVVAETIRCAPFIPPKEYWQIVREACDRHGALLILDEIPICLGRTGTMFTYEQYGVAPDMLVLGKGLGGGIFPLAALLARESLDVAPERALGHFTHEKSPVGCAAALATLDVIEEENLLQHTRLLGEHALERMQDLMQRYPLIGDVRGLGLQMGMELVKDRQTRVKAREEAEQVMYLALERGLSFKLTMGNILTLTPALTIQREQLDQAFDILESCIADVSRGKESVS